jgi:hypothetical protein
MSVTAVQPASIAPATADAVGGRVAELAARARIPVVVALITGLAGASGSVGADARWLAALGNTIAARGAVPHGIPFAAASSAHWANALVPAELAFHWLESAFGDRGLMIAQMLAVAVAMWLLGRDAVFGGAGEVGVAGALLAVAVGAFGSLAIARVQMFSLVLFALMVMLLRAQARAPSRRIWLALPMLAVWANLHGAVLSGVAVLYAYLLLKRGRTEPALAATVAIGALAAICVTAAGLRTPDYYYGLITNVAAQRGEGLWAPLGASPLDYALIAVALGFALRLRRTRLALWELAVVVGLALLTIHAARSGVWLLFFLAAPVAAASSERRSWNGLIPLALVLAVLLLGAAVAKPAASAATRLLVTRAVSLAHGSPVLADAVLAEQVALAGGRIWAGDPIDAFSRADQARYLNWLQGAGTGRAALSADISVVLVATGSAAQRLTARDPAYRSLAHDAATTLYVRER